MKRANSDSIKGTKQLRLTGFFSAPRPPATEISSSNENSPREPDSSVVFRKSLHEYAQEQATAPSPEKTAVTKGNSKRKFQATWLTELKWLNYDSDSGLAKCATCASFPEMSEASSKVVKGFAEPFKLDTFKKHGKSFPHLRCEEALKAQLDPASRPLLKCMKKMDETMLDHLKLVFNCAYYIAKNNKPFSDLTELLILVSKCDVNVSQQYTNRKSCKEFVSHIASVIRDDLIIDLKQSPYVSFLLDASTDKSGDEQQIFYVRYLKGKVFETFLFIVPLESWCADGYLTAMTQQLKNLGLIELMSQRLLVGVGTDGAAAMIGSQNGLVAKLSKLDGLDHILGVHCVAHKLNLGVLSSVKSVNYLEEVDILLIKTYKFYNYSPKRMRQLRKVSQALECELIKFKYLHNIRWVACKVQALAALVKDWKCGFSSGRTI